MPEEPKPKPAKKKPRWLMTPPMMRNVLIACVPAICGGVYRFGWRTLAVLAVSTIVGVMSEGVFVWPKGKPANGSVLVSALLFALILPPTIPLWMVAVGIAFGIVFAKMAFGGFGANVFNPAMSARCFVYICFPMAMTAHWVEPATAPEHPKGVQTWLVDQVTMATPLDAYKARQAAGAAGKLDDPSTPRLPGYSAMFLGRRAGCIGETSVLLILLGAAFMLARKTASWQIMVACIVGCTAAATVLWLMAPARVGDPLFQLLAGGFAFGTVFMATDPISAARTGPGKWIFGAMVGALTVVFRGYSSFSCGFMFAILIMNAFNPTLDSLVADWQKGQKKAGDA